MEFNELQSKLDLTGLHKDVVVELMEALTEIQFIKNLVSPKRPRIKDLEKSERGRIEVDLTNPHILENMDYFRQAAIHFEEHGCYTLLPQNEHPLSEFAQFWKEEARRCREGLIREDGEWVSGYHYFYLNYSPILLVEDTEAGHSVRIEGFPRMWDGDYLYFHYIEKAREALKHGNCLKARGRGYSFKGASQLAKVFVLGDREKSRKKQQAFAIANEKEFLIKGGILNKFVDITGWTAKNTPWPSNRLKDSLDQMSWVMGYKDPKSNKAEGVLNEVTGISLKNDPQKARGKRGPLVLWEEMGKFPRLLTAWGIARSSVEQGNKAFGTMLAFGTGGTEGADFTAAEEMFYNPRGYNIYALPNVYDKNVDSTTSVCAFFHPEYLNREDCMDENGNSDIIKGLLEVYVSRIEIKLGSSDPNAVVQDRAERPVTPQDAIMRREGSLFPVLDLKEYIAEISADIAKFVSPHYVGDLYITSEGQIKWKIGEGDPIRDYPVKDNLRKQGAIEIFQQPIRNHEGRIPWMRYIIGVDPIDDDYSQTNSLASCFVFDRFNDQIVAEYTGRPPTANEFYEIVYRLARYYHALINYENDKKGLFAFFSHRNALNYLCDTPQILRDMEYIKDPRMYGNKAKGTNSGRNINAWARKLQADWMRQIAVGESNEDIDEDGNLVEVVPLLNLQKIRSLGYLKEAVSWNPDGNFDRVSAMGMVMILREELAQHEAREIVEMVHTKKNDDFFRRMDQYTQTKSYNNQKYY